MERTIQTTQKVPENDFIWANIAAAPSIGVALKLFSDGTLDISRLPHQQCAFDALQY
jgi:hypothetical protein